MQQHRHHHVASSLFGSPKQFLIWRARGWGLEGKSSPSKIPATNVSGANEACAYKPRGVFCGKRWKAALEARFLTELLHGALRLPASPVLPHPYCTLLPERPWSLQVPLCNCKLISLCVLKWAVAFLFHQNLKLYSVKWLKLHSKLLNLNFSFKRVVTISSCLKFPCYNIAEPH